jgi:hypothetical protein
MTLDNAAIDPSSEVIPAPSTAPWETRKRALWAMSAPERIDAMRAGRLSLRECLHWASQHPAELPLLNGEFEFLAITTPRSPAISTPSRTTPPKPPQPT